MMFMVPDLQFNSWSKLDYGTRRWISATPNLKQELPRDEETSFLTEIRYQYVPETGLRNSLNVVTLGLIIIQVQFASA